MRSQEGQRLIQSPSLRIRTQVPAGPPGQSYILFCVDRVFVWQICRGQAAGSPWGSGHPPGTRGRIKFSLVSVSKILPSPTCSKSFVLLGLPEGATLTTSSSCSRLGPALPRPSLTSRPKTPHSSASAAVTSSRSWSPWTPTGGGAGTVGALASSRGAMSNRCSSDQSRAQGAESADHLSTGH